MDSTEAKNDIPQTPIRAALFEPGKYLSIPYEIMRRTDLTSAAKNCWQVLAGHLGSSGTAVWPSYTRTAVQTGLNRATVIRAIKSLEDMGLLAVERKEHNVNIYRLLQPPAGWSQKATSRKKQPVAKSNLTSRKKQPKLVAKCDPKYSNELLQEVNTPHPPQGGECAISDSEQAIQRVNAAMIEATGCGLTWLDKRRVRREYAEGAGPQLIARIDAAAVRGAIASTPTNRTFGWGWLVRYLQRTPMAQAQTDAAAGMSEAQYFATLPDALREQARAEASRRKYPPDRVEKIAMSIAYAWRLTL